MAASRMTAGVFGLPSLRLRTRPLNSAAARRRVCPFDPPGRGSGLRFLRCRSHAVTMARRSGAERFFLPYRSDDSFLILPFCPDRGAGCLADQPR